MLRFCAVLVSALVASALLASPAFAKRGMIVTTPKAMQAGTTEKMFVTFHDIDFDVEMTALLKSKKSPDEFGLWRFLFRAGQSQVVDLTMPDAIPSENVDLLVEASSVDAVHNYTFTAKTPIIFGESSLITFLQTDKPMYKPGQTVLFRMLTLKADLTPHLGEISEIWIRNPSGSRLAQWSDVNTDNGLASFEFVISDDPIQGTWKIMGEINGKRTWQKFDVKEYVLPKFEVTVKPPSYVPVDATIVEGEICAVYTYGKPVKGNVEIKVCVVGSYDYNKRRPCHHIVDEINGCVRFKVNASMLMLSSRNFGIYNAQLTVDASVIEEATGVRLNGTGSASITQRLLNLEFEPYSSGFFKPGLPYYGKIVATKPDGTPAPGENVTLKVIDDTRGSMAEQIFNYVTDTKGQFYFKIPPFQPNMQSFTIHAMVPRYAVKKSSSFYSPFEPRFYHSVKEWFSPSGSLLQLSPIDGEQDCTGKLKVNVSYTTEGNDEFDIYYQVMSRGNIVAAGPMTNREEVLVNMQVEEDEVAEEDGRVEVVEEVIVDESVDAPDQTVINIEVDPETGREAKKRKPIKLPAYVSSFVYEIPVSALMSPISRVLVYYVRDDGETVADSQTIRIQKCLQNKVELQFGKKEKMPGSKVNVKLRADGNSMCSVVVVDKSVSLMGGSKRLTMDKVFEYLSKYDLKEGSYSHVRNNHCSKETSFWDFAIDRHAHRPAPRKHPGPERHKRSVYIPGNGFSRYVDSIKAFKMVGVRVMTDLILETRPCETHRIMYRKMSVRGMLDVPAGAGMAVQSFSPITIPMAVGQTAEDSKEIETAVEIRSYFPETWLWELIDVGPSGSKVVKEEVPHTITEWVGNMFCTNSVSGLGVSAPATLKAFQPFFLSFTLPYSIVRGEKATIPVTVFSYLPGCMVVQLVMKKTKKGLDVIGTRETHLCVCGNEAKTHRYIISASVLGEVDLTVKAKSVTREGVCGNGVDMVSQSKGRDIVTRVLLVEPEGREVEYTRSQFVCPSDHLSPIREPMSMSLGENMEEVVPGSARGTISVIGDVMGPTLSGLDKLLKMPMGCGEQTMILFAPNVYILQYLTTTSQLTAGSPIKMKAINFMNAGYQRELTFRHRDGSYSAFGDSDDSGSMWLTAFVVKSFAQAREFVFIDSDQQRHSIAWFRNKQLENGCFPKVGRVLHKAMKGGVGGSTASLTAFVLLAMLEEGTPVQDEGVQQAVRCLESQTISDVYTLSLLAYAYTLMDRNSLRRQGVMSRLEQLAISEEGMKHWGSRTGGSVGPAGTEQQSSADIEMTSYVLLAYITKGLAAEVVPDAMPIVKWLSKQRNAHGGFKSTQDTVVALQALSKYASLLYGTNVDLVIRARGQGINKKFSVTSNNTLLLQRQAVPVPNHMQFEVSGVGCVLHQVHVKYNVYNMTGEGASFVLHVTVDDIKCMKSKINICATYVGDDDASNMAVLEVKMVSGWLPEKQSLKRLQTNRELELKKFEIEKNMVNFYFDELTHAQKCFSFNVLQEVEVKETKPAYVIVYDYYKNELFQKLPYSITNDLCNLVPVQEEIIVKTEASLLGGRTRERSQNIAEPSALPTPVTTCPRCYSNLQQIGNWEERFCASKHAYWVILREDSIMSITSDIRVRQRSLRRIITTATFELPSECECHPLTTGGVNKRLLVMTGDTPLAFRADVTLPAKLRLDSQVTIVPLLTHRSIRGKRCPAGRQ